MVYQYNGLKEKITAHAGKECADFAAKLTTATAGDGARRNLRKRERVRV